MEIHTETREQQVKLPLSVGAEALSLMGGSALSSSIYNGIFLKGVSGNYLTIGRKVNPLAARRSGAVMLADMYFLDHYFSCYTMADQIPLKGAMGVIMVYLFWVKYRVFYWCE